MSLVGTILYFVFGFGFHLYTKLFRFLTEHAFSEMGINLFWATLFVGFIVLSIGVFFTIYMYTSLFAFILYPLFIFLLGPFLVVTAIYAVYLVFKTFQERRKMAPSNEELS
ncbi:hypothetical protein ACKW0K_000046 [Listeria monocytogenes]|nr:hypothetical protein [Listeria monocytogenes]EAC5024910.1 hypothetical protein [Listeria monocytogenes]EAC6063030.1 hypothetical protein [Listeria monocytogenes]EAC6175324.1 hypothetical protein [Listeria monocytogenes]EAC7892553.1 hypothetical protein [Listeria monocytogenes]